LEVNSNFILSGISASYIVDALKVQIQEYTQNYGPGAIVWTAGYVQPTTKLFDESVVHLTLSANIIRSQSPSRARALNGGTQVSSPSVTVTSPSFGSSAYNKAVGTQKSTSRGRRDGNRRGGINSGRKNVYSKKIPKSSTQAYRPVNKSKNV